MTDILDDLRGVAKAAKLWPHGIDADEAEDIARCERAADEIQALRSKLDRVSKLLDDWAEAEKQGLGVPLLAGIGQIREALK